mmetsp:Transcript_20346/g.56601  ORF Transcript_20346/g.56601 Transcript_20346/m.56601 type:complete len:429 (+) Transcript_20346:200-1486(+)|eukprot:CAMPEP_0172363784 /NCGR_PEP_ID=MMETSP1060-20121228/7046_1 /TAXON_ID=37318 /ORGANISM="Pseudo-nitzschia pungens, Strain cf. cingulata" /LENGTH=428 /DNA_ID=CAMNT_0013086607 /DNA_START=138 /DNA_END=1427 /DNA_ORIENTATION=+
MKTTSSAHTSLSLKSTFHLMLLSLMTRSAVAQTDNCSGVSLSYSTTSSDSCVDWSERSVGDVLAYPDDFDGLTSQVAIYTCPTSDKRVIISNGVPDHTVTIVNTNNVLCEYNWAVEIPLNPVENEEGLREVPIRGMIAMAVNGVPAYGPQESDSLNAVEVSESTKSGAGFWYGHAGADNSWHVHNPNMGKETVTSDDFLGYSMDGFPIYGPLDDDTLLDACNGITNDDGSYQYHVRTFEQVDEDLDYCNGDSPATNWNYILGCYKGTPDDSKAYVSTTYTLPSDCVLESTTPSPTKSPTKKPTHSPTKNPTASPTGATSQSSCEDSPLSVSKYDTCDGVVEADKCGKKKFWSHCRASCDKCNKCVDSKQKLKMTSKVEITWVDSDGETVTKNKKKFKCTKVKKATNQEEICSEYTDVALSCPKACGVC